MKADFLVLCGGLGTRLRSVTGETPKALAQVQGEPFLDFLIRYLIKQGACRIILCAGYKAEAFKEYYQKKHQNIDIQMSIEKEPLGTGGALKYAQPLIKHDIVFGLNGDCFTPVNYQQLLAQHQTYQALATLVGVRVENNKDFGTIETNQRSEITAFKEKISTTGISYINAGVYCFQREVFSMMPEGKFSVEYDFFPRLIHQKFFCHKVDAPFIDIGTPERFEWAKQHLSEMLI